MQQSEMYNVQCPMSNVQYAIVQSEMYNDHRKLIPTAIKQKIV